MLRSTSLPRSLLLVAALCCSSLGSAAQESDEARSKALQALVDFLKTKGIDLKPADTGSKSSYIQYQFTIGPDHQKDHRIGLNYLPPLTLEQAREKYQLYSLPKVFHRDWALIKVGGPGGNATPEYQADWKRVLASFQEYPGPLKPRGKN